MLLDILTIPLCKEMRSRINEMKLPQNTIYKCG